jgi:hypothetical protein
MTLSLPPFTLEVDGRTYHCEHAVVSQFSIGREDHGIMTIKVEFSGESWGQSLPLFSLESTKGVQLLTKLVDALGSPWRGIGVNTPVVVMRRDTFGSIAGFATHKGGKTGEPVMVDAIYPESYQRPVEVR